MTDKSWSLKILSGAHLGAEIELGEGTYTLGSHEDCDFVLTDESVSDKQLEITINDASIKLKSLSGQQLTINGEPSGIDCQPEMHQVVSISALNFAFGQSDIPWPAFNLSQFSSTAEGVHNNNAETTNTSSDKAYITEEQTEKKAHNLAAVTDKENKDSGKKSWRKTGLTPRQLALWFKKLLRHYKWILAGFSSLALFVCLGVGFMWLWQKTAPEANLKTTINYLAIAKKVKSQLMLPDIHLRQLAGGSILVSGYIKDNDQKNMLIKTLDKELVPIKSQLIVMSDMRASAVSALKFAGYDNMHIELDTTPGSLVLSGYAPNIKYVSKIREILSIDVPGLLSIVEQVDYQSTREKALRTMLQEVGLNAQIKLLEQPGKITLKGRLHDISQGYRFKSVVTNFREKYGNKPELMIDVVIPSANLRTLKPELNIKSISMGRTPYVMLGNGEKYLPGATLENGYILESIGLDYLILRSGNQQIKYNVRKNND